MCIIKSRFSSPVDLHYFISLSSCGSSSTVFFVTLNRGKWDANSLCEFLIPVFLSLSCPHGSLSGCSSSLMSPSTFKFPLPPSCFYILTPRLNLPSPPLLNSSHKFFSSASCDTRLYVRVNPFFLCSDSSVLCTQTQQLAGCLDGKMNLLLSLSLFCVISVQSCN